MGKPFLVGSVVSHRRKSGGAGDPLQGLLQILQPLDQEMAVLQHQPLPTSHRRSPAAAGPPAPTETERRLASQGCTTLCSPRPPRAPITPLASAAGDIKGASGPRAAEGASEDTTLEHSSRVTQVHRAALTGLPRHPELQPQTQGHLPPDRVAWATGSHQ